MKTSNHLALETYYTISQREGSCPFSLSELETLHRYSKISQRFNKMQCNGELEQDPETGKYERVFYNKYTRQTTRTPYPDKISKPKAAVLSILDKHKWSYQTNGDPRGVPLRISPKPKIEPYETGEYPISDG